MHHKAKARIAAKKAAKETRPELIKHLPKTGDLYTNAIGGIDRLLEDILDSKKLTPEQAANVMRLKSKLELN